MTNQPYLEEFIKKCSETEFEKTDEQTDEKYVGWEDLIRTLVFGGFVFLMPEIKEWVKLGMSTIALKRLEIKKKLEEYAAEKELDFPQAEKAAEAVANNLDKETLTKIVEELES